MLRIMESERFRTLLFRAGQHRISREARLSRLRTEGKIVQEALRSFERLKEELLVSPLVIL